MSADNTTDLIMTTTQTILNTADGDIEKAVTILASIVWNVSHTTHGSDTDSVLKEIGQVLEDYKD